MIIIYSNSRLIVHFVPRGGALQSVEHEIVNIFQSCYKEEPVKVCHLWSVQLFAGLFLTNKYTSIHHFCLLL